MDTKHPHLTLAGDILETIKTPAGPPAPKLSAAEKLAFQEQVKAEFAEIDKRVYLDSASLVDENTPNFFLRSLKEEFYENRKIPRRTIRIATSAFNGMLSNKQQAVLLTKDKLAQCYLQDPNWTRNHEKVKLFEKSLEPEPEAEDLEEKVETPKKKKWNNVMSHSERSEATAILGSRFQVKVHRVLPVSKILIFAFTREAASIMGVGTEEDLAKDIKRIEKHLAQQNLKILLRTPPFKERTEKQKETFFDNFDRLSKDYPSEISTSVLATATQKKGKTTISEIVKFWISQIETEKLVEFAQVCFKGGLLTPKEIEDFISKTLERRGEDSDGKIKKEISDQIMKIKFEEATEKRAQLEEAPLPQNVKPS